MIAWLKKLLWRGPEKPAGPPAPSRRNPPMHYVPRGGSGPTGDGRWVLIAWCGQDDPERYTFDVEELTKVAQPCSGCMPGLRAARVHRLTHR